MIIITLNLIPIFFFLGNLISKSNKTGFSHSYKLLSNVPVLMDMPGFATVNPSYWSYAHQLTGAPPCRLRQYKVVS